MRGDLLAGPRHRPALALPRAPSRLVAERCSLPRGLARADGPSLRGALPPFLAVPASSRSPSTGATGWMRPATFFSTPGDLRLRLPRRAHARARDRAPPQVPGVSGFPLGYHLGTDLVSAAALRWAGTDPWDSLTRLDVTLWASVSSWPCGPSPRRLGAPPLASRSRLGPSSSRISPSSLPGTRRPTGGPISCAGTSCSRSPTRTRSSRPSASSSAPSSRCRACRRRTPAGTSPSPPSRPPRCPSSRSFWAPTCSSGWASRGSWPAGRPVGRSCSPPSLRLATAALALGQGGRTVRSSWPRSISPASRERPWASRRSRGVACRVGTAWLSARSACGSSRCPRPFARSGARPPLACSGAIALAGWPLGLLFRVSAPEVLGRPEGRQRRGLPRRAIGAAPLGLRRHRPGAAAPRRRRGARPRSAPACSSPPLHVQFAAKKAQTPPDRLPAAMVRAAQALERVSRPGDVVMQRPGARYPPAPVVLVGRRGALRALHALPHAVRLTRRSRGPPRARLPLLPDNEPGGGAGDRAVARRAASWRSTGGTACGSTRRASSSPSTRRKARGSTRVLGGATPPPQAPPLTPRE